MLNLSHKKLDVWKLSIELIKLIYKLTEGFPKSELFGITNQLRRASVSVASNLAEGCGFTNYWCNYWRWYFVRYYLQ